MTATLNKIRISCDDGCASDMRLAELCDKYDIECIFYWPVEWHSLAYDNGYKPLKYSDADAIAKRFEIGSHTITHRHLTKIPFGDAAYEIVHSQAALQNLFRVPIKKFCPPRGYTNTELTKLTLQHYELQRLTKQHGLVHIHPDSGANENVHWRKRVEEVKVKEIWCHSYDLDRFEMWKELEEYLGTLN